MLTPLASVQGTVQVLPVRRPLANPAHRRNGRGGSPALQAGYFLGGFLGGALALAPEGAPVRANPGIRASTTRSGSDTQAWVTKSLCCTWSPASISVTL